MFYFSFLFLFFWLLIRVLPHDYKMPSQIDPINPNSKQQLYTIVAPRYIRPHFDYKVSLTLHGDVEPTTICFSIVDGQQYKNEKSITITSNKTELVSLHINEFDITKLYEFVVEGIS